MCVLVRFDYELLTNALSTPYYKYKSLIENVKKRKKKCFFLFLKEKKKLSIHGKMKQKGFQIKYSIRFGYLKTNEYLNRIILDHFKYRLV